MQNDSLDPSLLRAPSCASYLEGNIISLFFCSHDENTLFLVFRRELLAMDLDINQVSEPLCLSLSIRAIPLRFTRLYLLISSFSLSALHCLYLCARWSVWYILNFSMKCARIFFPVDNCVHQVRAVKREIFLRYGMCVAPSTLHSRQQ